MSNPSSDPNPGTPSTSAEPSFGEDAPPSWAEEDQTGMPDGVSAALATDMARSWVRRHQTATLLGAFATGVFVGAMLRD